jgi:LmbE family N-acetylglucosaminyl deacetylase
VTADETKPVLAVFAHPDDEVLCAAGTLALCRARGRPVTLVCATRGELGPIADPRLATADTLGEVREAELRASCAALGIADVRVLGLPDAGVDWSAPPRGVLSSLVQLIREQRPLTLIGFGPDGLYGHCDHVGVHELMIRARAVAADPQFEPEHPIGTAPAYWVPRSFYPVMTADTVSELLQQRTAAGKPAQLWSLSPSAFHVLAAEISAEVDVRKVLDRKLRALHCHRTQLEADNALALLEGELAVRILGFEHFRCADGLPGDPLDA